MVSQLQGYQLSPQQRRLFLLQESDRQRYAQCIVQLDGKLNLEQLHQAIKHVVRRHDILRTNYRSMPGMKYPVQVVSEFIEPLWNDIDVSNQGSEEQIAIIEQVATQERETTCDLEHDSPLKFTLCRLAPNKHQLMIMLSALCADPGSLDNLVEEIANFYNRIEIDEEQEELIQYVQFSEWQHALQEEEQAAAGKMFWQQQYTAVEELQLPDSMTQASQADGLFYGSLEQTLSSETVAKIQQVAQEYDVQEKTILLACWQILFWRLTQQNDILVGTFFDGRKYEDLRNGIGLYTKYLPVRSHFSEQSRFHEVLNEIDTQLDEAEELQEFISGDAIDEMNGTAQGFYLGFEASQHKQPASTADMIFTILKHFVYSEPFALKLACVQYQQDTITLEIHYRRNTFNRDYIQHICERLQTLLEDATNNPQHFVSQLCIIGEIERAYLLRGFNDTVVDDAEQRCLHQIFEEQVTRTPENVAVQFAEQPITYAELNAQANQIAHYLQDRGVGPDVPVAVFLEHGFNLMAALLGVLKAGGAYVPLDPGLPRERLTGILQQIQPPVVLTQKSLAIQLPEDTTSCVCLDTQWELLSGASTENPDNSVCPQHLAYIIFTSGSTGSPKGAMITQQGLTNYLYWSSKTYPLTDGSGTLVHSSIGFDLTVTSLFTSLLVGQKVHLLPNNEKIDTLAEAFSSEKLYSLIKLTPAHLEVLNRLLAPEVLASSTKSLVIGGEALYNSTLERWREHAPMVRLFNEYGPTETVVGCSMYEATTNTTVLEAVPIGRPIDNIQIYILDANMQPVPAGVSGELYVAGVALARGYFASPDLTAERFVPHPFCDSPGALLYKTGDLARLNANSQLEFIGRIDSQVKVRGYRIELSEIEAQLSQHPQVRQCVVLVQETETREKQIVAYVVSQKEERVSIDQEAMLRTYLKEKLPHYMLPAHFVLLDALPLTANGKVNRSSLSTFDWHKAEQQKQTEAKALLSPIEELLLQHWQQILSREQIEIHENFFEIGGHSLLAAQLVARLQQTLDIEVPLRVLFDAPTIAAFAEWLTQRLQQSQGISVPAIVAVPRNQQQVPSFAQQRLWFLDQLGPGNTAYSIPAAVRLHGKLNRAALEHAFIEVVKRHEILRASFPAQAGQPVLQIATEPTVRLHRLDLSHLSQEEREPLTQQLIRQAVEQPFDLAHGPLLRCWLLQLAEEQHVLLLTLHHIVSDGQSMHILVQELTSLYTAYLQGKASPLPALAVQYADYAHWQRSWLQGEPLQQQLNYWKKQLADIVPLALPTDYPRPPHQTFQAGHLRLHLSHELSLRVQELSRREGMTLFMTLLAAFNVLLYYYTRQDDLVVGTNVANRNRAETERLIGFFVNQLVLRTSVAGDPTFYEILRRVKETALGAYVHQDLPFDRLLVELNPERDLSRTPLFQVKFALEHVPTQEIALPELTAEQIEFEEEMETTKSDIFLTIVENNGELAGSLEYRLDLFRAETITRFLHLFTFTIEQVVAFPEIRLSEIAAALAREDTEKRSEQERERRQQNAQRLGQSRRKTKSQVEPQ